MRFYQMTGVVLAVVVAALGQPPPVAAAEQDLRLLRVRFTDPPSVRRGTQDAATWLGGDIAVRAAVEVTGSSSARGTAVRFFARSTDGVTTSRVALADEHGRASVTLALRLPLASHDVITLACLAQESSICTAPATLDLRRRIAVGGTLSFALTGRTPSLVENASALIESDLATSVLGRVTVDLHVADSVGFYAAVPIESHRRTLTAFATTPLGVRRVTPQGSATGLGSFVGGLRILRDRFVAEVELSGGGEGRDAVSSLRGTGPGLVVIGEGFNTISTSFQYARPIRRPASATGDARPPRMFIVGGGLSHGFPQRFDDGTEARRGLIGRVSAGVATPSPTGARVYSWWGGYSYSAGATIPVPQRPRLLIEPHHDVEVGLRVQWLRWRGIVRPSLMVGANAVLDGQPAVVAMFGLEFLPLQWGQR